MTAQVQRGQILILSALVLAVMIFLVGLVIGAAQLHATQAQMEKAAELGARAGALELGNRLATISPHLSDWETSVETLVQEGQRAAADVASANGAETSEITLNSPWEIEVIALKRVRLIAGIVPETTVSAKATARALARSLAAQ